MTSVLTRPVPPSGPGGDQATPKPESNRGFRPDVQGLRAIAVSLVVIYHLYPNLLPGGYVGVDVFFVISGFLITGLLLRSHERHGRVNLLEFYGRRARRLMPAAILVLTVTWLVSRSVLPATQLSAAADQIRASALYFQNWVLAHNAVDYLSADQAASPVQHFWSLSVEEQFYLIWPLLFVIAALVGSQRARARVTRTVLFVLALSVVLASLAFSIHETRTNPSAAYFVTTTRLWELGFGGLLAMVPARIATRVGRVGLLAWVGLAFIAYSAFEIKGTAAFPGSIALIPVTGAVLLLAAGSSEARLSPARLTAARPMVFLGDISYSLYLWHWPIIVLWMAYSGSGIGILDGPAIIVVSIVLAWLTKKFVEDGVRMSPLLAPYPGRSLITLVLAVVPVALTSLFLAGQPGSFNGTLDAKHPGAAYLAGDVSTLPSASPLPAVTQVAADSPIATNHTCLVVAQSATPHTCTFGYTGANPTLTVALVGDSHASEWSTALDDIAKTQHWKLVTDLHAGCPFTATPIVAPKSTVEYTNCTQWDKSVEHDLVTTIKPDVVITSELPVNGTVGDIKPDATSQQAIGAGMVTYWKDMMAAGIDVVAIHETPVMAKDVPDCLSARGGSVASCSTPASQAILSDSPIDIAARALNGAVPIVNMNSLICGPTTCAPIVGNVIPYQDAHHLSATYTRTAETYLQQKLVALKPFALNT